MTNLLFDAVTFRTIKCPIYVFNIFACNSNVVVSKISGDNANLHRLRGEANDLNPNEGRVEVLMLSVMGMICDGYWGKVDADVACRQLGFEK